MILLEVLPDPADFQLYFWEAIALIWLPSLLLTIKLGRKMNAGNSKTVSIGFVFSLLALIFLTLVLLFVAALIFAPQADPVVVPY